MVRTMPGQFSVEELILLPPEAGAFSYYRVEKQNTPVDTVRHAMASQFDVTPSAVVFPALRDFSERAVQYASVRKSGPEVLRGKGYTARYIQHGPRALRPVDLQGNRFTIKLRHLPSNKVQDLREILNWLQTHGLPNYFGAQHFRSMTQHGFIGRSIIKHEPLQALRLYISEPSIGDTKNTRDFKTLAKSHWGQWGYLLHQAPRPSNLRSVITYLKDHPRDYEKAINLIRDQLLARYLETYQGWIWNHILANYLRSKGKSTAHFDISGTSFPILAPEQRGEGFKDLIISLPRLTAHYPGGLAEAVEKAMADEGITKSDFNVRLVRRVCLVKRDRSAWFAPIDVKVEQSNDSPDSENHPVTISFDLQIRQYATLIVRAALDSLEKKTAQNSTES